ncbi:Transposon Tf2-11 polyprotein [Smittium culicis]|uniref:Transposon Tf2-11 polyprotein n=1 Tax=Smittium culicis TaxID=133412 RepID=A0A1R1YIA4_9FUNG|nr:Transposon Tf2-11 polyprotein [Smittium culicis]
MSIKKTSTFPESKMKCFNCGEIGNGTRSCSKKKNFEMQEKLYSEYINKNSPEKNIEKSMLMVVLESESPKKRIRIDDLINNKIPNRTENPEKIIKPSTIVSKSKPKKKINSAINNSLSALSGRILDSDAPISVRELFKISPKYLNDTIKLLQQIRNSKNGSILYNSTYENEIKSYDDEDQTPININAPSALSYLLCKIGEKNIPLFIDVGSSACVVSIPLLKALGIPYTPKQTRVTSVGGDSLTIVGVALIPIKFEEITIYLYFKVLKKCAVSIILGLDVCQILKAKIDYENQTFEIKFHKEIISLQIYTKENILQISDEENETNTLDSIEIENDSDDDKILLALNLAEISDAGSPPEIENPTKLNFKPDSFYSKSELSSMYADSNLNSNQLLDIENLVYKYKDLFPIDYSQIPGIIQSNYSLKIPEDATPYSARLRRFNLHEKQTILDEISKMLQNGIIEPSNSEWRFLKNLFEIIETLQKLSKKDTKYIWDEECDKSFNNIKYDLTNDPILKQPDDHNLFFLSTDASSYAIGGVLEQFDDNNELRPISFYSRKLQKSEINYMSYEKEALALFDSKKILDVIF